MYFVQMKNEVYNGAETSCYSSNQCTLCIIHWIIHIYIYIYIYIIIYNYIIYNIYHPYGIISSYVTSYTIILLHTCDYYLCNIILCEIRLLCSICCSNTHQYTMHLHSVNVCLTSYPSGFATGTMTNSTFFNNAWSCICCTHQVIIRRETKTYYSLNVILLF